MRQIGIWFRAATGWRLAVPAAVVAILLFSPVLWHRAFLLTTDDSIGILSRLKTFSPASFAGGWDDATLFGTPFVGWISWTGVALWALPVSVFNNWIHGLDLFLGAVLLGVMLVRDRVDWKAALVGMMCAYFVGTNLTLVYAGHMFKFGTLIFAAAFLLVLSLDKPGNRWSVLLLAGGALAGMFLEQQDLALFMMVVLGPYWLFRCWHTYGTKGMGLPLLRAAVAMGAVFALLALAPVFGIYRSNTSGIVGQDRTAPEERWLFATQWSVPPNETIDLIAPNYFGIRSGEPAGPYWGRTGRSAGWEQTRQGFMNFKLESIYIGAIPVVLALFAVVAALVGRRGQRAEGRGQKKNEPHGSETLSLRNERAAASAEGLRRAEGGGAPSSASAKTTADTEERKATPEPRTPRPDPSWADRRAEILFWAAAALITLLLAYGKYFPLYALFYKLPVVNNIRNPNKFLQVFQLCLGILAAYGLDAAVRMGRTTGKSDE